MRRRRFWPRRRGSATAALLDLAPLVDVVFLLLAFFIVVGASARAGAVSIEVPSVEEGVSSATASAHLSVDARDRLFWDGEEILFEALPGRLQGVAARDGALRITGDAASSLGTLMRIHQRCRRAGVRRIEIDVRTVPEGTR